jgi:hypothetical protein
MEQQPSPSLPVQQAPPAQPLHPLPVVTATVLRSELDAVLVVVDAVAVPAQVDASVPVVHAQLIHLCQVIGAEPPPTEPSASLQTLLTALDDASTNSERWSLLTEALRNMRKGELTCARAALLAKKFSFTFRQKQALVDMYPLLGVEERAGFAAIVEQVLPSTYDRKDVLREVALAD